MNILIIGGTGFVGRHITARAIHRGHNVSLLNRCNDMSLFPQIKRYCKDRNNDIGVKINTDCVIDVSGYKKNQVKNILDNVDTDYYVFISTIGVTWNQQYIQILQDSIDLNNTIFKDYIDNKIECEKEIMNKVKNFMIFRPKYICGKYDNTYRFEYSNWPKVYWNNTNIEVDYTDVSELSYDIISKIENREVGIV